MNRFISDAGVVIADDAILTATRQLGLRRVPSLYGDVKSPQNLCLFDIAVPSLIESTRRWRLSDHDSGAETIQLETFCGIVRPKSKSRLAPYYFRSLT